MTREQLDQRARELGHPAPERLPNKAAVEAAINELESKMNGSGDELETGGEAKPIGPGEDGNFPPVETEALNPGAEVRTPTYEGPGGRIMPADGVEKTPIEAPADGSPVELAGDPAAVEARAAAAIYAEAGNPGDFADAPEATRATFLRYAKAALEA